MTTLNPFPQPNKSLSSIEDLRRSFADPAYANDVLLRDAILSLEVLISQSTKSYAQDEVPDSASVGDLWISALENNAKRICTIAYSSTSQNKLSNWEVFEDAQARTQIRLISTQEQQAGTFIDQTIEDMATDSSISIEEKISLEPYYNQVIATNALLLSRATFLNLISSATYTDYASSFTTLRTYIDSTIALFNDLSTSTAVVSLDWIANWSSLRSRQSSLELLIDSTANSLLDSLQTDISAVSSAVSDITSDSIISSNEKTILNREYLRIKENKLQIDAQALLFDLATSSEYTTFVNDYNALVTFVDTTISIFSSPSTSTSINRSTFNAQFNTYYQSERAIDQALESANRSSISVATNLASSVSSDGIISAGTEKAELLASWTEITRKHARRLSLAGVYNLAVPTAYTNRYNQLEAYLTTSSGINVFNDPGTDTIISPTQFKAHFDNFYNERAIFITALDDAQKATIESGPLTYEATRTQLSDIALDSKLSAGSEKTRTIALWLDIQATHQSFVQQANATGVNSATLKGSFDALTAEIDAITDFADATKNSIIGVATFYQKFRDYYVSKSIVQQQITDQLILGVSGQQNSILGLAADSTILPSEKAELKIDYDQLTQKRIDAINQADDLGITTEKTALETATSSLDTYLGSLEAGTGLLTNLTTTANLSDDEKTNWTTNWTAFFSALDTLEVAITAAIQGTFSTLTNISLRKDGTVALTADWAISPDNSRQISGFRTITLSSGGNNAAVTGQLFNTNTGSGLTPETGAYIVESGANFIQAATSLADAILKLDTQTNTNTTAINDLSSDDVVSDSPDFSGSSVTDVLASIKTLTDTLSTSIDERLELTGGVLTGDLLIGKNDPALKIIGLVDQDILSVEFSVLGTLQASITRGLLEPFLSINSASATTGLSMKDKKIIDLLAPTSDLDAATKKYVDDQFGFVRAPLIAKGERETGDSDESNVLTIAATNLTATGRGANIHLSGGIGDAGCHFTLYFTKDKDALWHWQGYLENLSLTIDEEPLSGSSNLSSLTEITQMTDEGNESASLSVQIEDNLATFRIDRISETFFDKYLAAIIEY